jgi:hypothetical protein
MEFYVTFYGISHHFTDEDRKLRNVCGQGRTCYSVLYTVGNILLNILFNILLNILLVIYCSIYCWQYTIECDIILVTEYTSRPLLYYRM